MTIADHIRAALIDSGKLPEGTEVQVEQTSEARYNLDLSFPPAVQPEDRSEWVSQVVEDVEDVLRLAIVEGVLLGDPQDVRTEVRDGSLHVHPPTGPLVRLMVFGVLLKPEDFE